MNKLTKVKLFYARYNEEGSLYTATLAVELSGYELSDLKWSRYLHLEDIILRYLAKWNEKESFAGLKGWKLAKLKGEGAS